MFNLGRQPANAKKAHRDTRTATQTGGKEPLLTRNQPLWRLTVCANVSHREHDTVTFHRWNTAEWEIILAFTTKTEPLTIGGGDVRLSSHGTWDRYSTVVSGLEPAYMTVEVDRGYFQRRPAAPSTDVHLDPQRSGALLRMLRPRSRASVVFTARRH